VQRTKVEAKESRKRKLQRDRGAETAANLLNKKTFHGEAALSQDNLQQWTGVNRLLTAEEVVIQDEEEWAELGGQHHASSFVTTICMRRRQQQASLLDRRHEHGCSVCEVGSRSAFVA
jgi:hypothetical protein